MQPGSAHGRISGCQRDRSFPLSLQQVVIRAARWFGRSMVGLLRRHLPFVESVGVPYEVRNILEASPLS